MTTMFMGCFHQSFLPEAPKGNCNMKLKFQVTFNSKKNAPNLPESVFPGNKTVQVVYLPPNISSLLQFLDHCIILSRLHIFIWYQLIINRLLTETDYNLDRMGSFKSFTINDTITFIKAAVS